MIGTGAEVVRYLVQAVGSLYLVIVLLRLLLQLARADFYNDLSQFIVKATNPLLRPLRRVIPPIGRVDTASLVLALAIQVLASCILMGFTIPNPLMLMLWGAIGLPSLTVEFFFWALIAMIVVSWIAPGSRHPALILIYQLTEPVMAPVRKLLPPMGGLDFSPILVFLLINVLEIVIRGLATQAHLPFGLVLGI